MAALRLKDCLILPSTTAFGVYDHNLVGLAQRRDDGRPDTLWRVRARHIVVAAGAIERPLLFANNDRPGVMSADAALVYLQRYGVARRRAHRRRHQQRQRARGGRGLGRSRRRRHDRRQPPRRMRRRRGVRRAGPANDRRRSRPQRGRKGDARRRRGSRRRLRSRLRRMDPDRSISSARRAASSLGARRSRPSCPRTRSPASAWRAPRRERFLSAMRWRAGLQAARALRAGRSPRAAKHGKRKYARHSSGLAEVRARRDGIWIDYQSDVTVKDVELAARENFVSVEHLKRYTTLGMATDQGKTSNLNGLALLADITGRPIAEVGTTTYRPPFTPVPFADARGPARRRADGAGAAAAAGNGASARPRRVPGIRRLAAARLLRRPARGGVDPRGGEARAPVRGAVRRLDARQDRGDRTAGGAVRRLHLLQHDVDAEARSLPLRLHAFRDRRRLRRRRPGRLDDRPLRRFLLQFACGGRPRPAGGVAAGPLRPQAPVHPQRDRRSRHA